MPAFLQLFLTFFKIGLFTFGGGYAMLSIITDNCVERYKWITHEDMMNITIIAETTPGPVAINCATFVGYRKDGIRGAIAATVGVVLPSFIIIYLISLFLESFLEIAVVAHAFQGIKIAVGFLILQAGLKLMKQLGKNPASVILLCLAVALVLVTNIFGVHISTIVLMVCSAVVGIALFGVKKGGGKR